jgi:chain length determinant protein tyrosine kinase EpsG
MNPDFLPVGFRAEQRIGKLLLDAGKLTPEDAEKALRLQKDKGLRFGEAAKQLGFITDADIQQALGRQFDYPYLQPGEANFSPELVAAYSPFSSQVEALRGLRTQLMLRWFADGHKALAIVGSSAGEGASYTAANLAVVFSQLGERTLLIDADLRTPRQHDIFKLRNRHGLSDALAGKTGLEAIERIPAFVDLSVLPAGTTVPNPQELLGRPALVELLGRLGAHYDVILLDTSPGAMGADAQTVTARAGGALMVARKNYTRLNAAAALKEQLATAGAEVVGTVLNEY